MSHTIIETPDSLGLTRTHSDSLRIGLSPKIHPKVYGRVPLANPFTIRPFFRCPTLLLGRRTNSDSLGLTRNYPDLGYLLKYTQTYTVVYLGPIRSLLDPFQISPTIMGTSDGREGYRGQYLDLGPDGRLAFTQGFRLAV